MNKILLALMMIGCHTITQFGYAGGGAPKKDTTNIQSYQLVCGPGMTDCKQVTVEATKPPSLNKVGDLVTWDISGAPTKDLGTIKEAKTVSMPIPTSGKFIYTFTPEKGHRLIAGKPVDILFVVLNLDESLPSGTPESVVKEETDAKSKDANIHRVIKTYAKKPGETQWTELATYRTPETDLSGLKPLDANITPDGTVTVPQVMGAKLEADLGKISG